MASTYSDLKFELIGTGDQSGVWGTTTNDNIGTAIEQALVGLGNPIFTTDANLTISLTNTVALQTARALVLNATSSGSLTATRELVVPTIEKQYIVQNNTTGGQSITVKTTAGTGITVTNGRKAHLYVDGVNVIQMFDFVDINGGAIDGTPIGASSASTGAFTSLTDSGNLAFTGTGNRITGDFSNATFANRVAFQSSTTNANTLVAAIPNGTSTTAGLWAYNNSDLTNAGRVRMTASSTEMSFIADYNGTGTYLPMAFSTGGSERVRIDTSGNFLIGTGTNGTGRLQVTDAVNYTFEVKSGGSGISTIGGTSGTTQLAFQVNATEGMRLTSTGLGIGTSSPGYKLVAAGANGVSAAVDMNGAISTGAEFSSLKFTASVYSFIGSEIRGINTNGGTNLGVMAFHTSGTEKMRLDSSGNLGLGVTPSAWQSIYRALQAPGGSAFVGRNDGGIETITTANAYRDSGGTWKYVGTGVALRYAQDSDGHKWSYAASGTAGNAITFTQAMTLSAAGGLSIGTTADAGAGNILLPGTNGTIFGSATTGSRSYIEMYNSSTGNMNIAATYSTAAITFATGGTTTPTERARIDSSGNLLVGTTSSTFLADSGGFIVYPTSSGETNFVVKHDTGTTSGATYASFTYATSSIGNITQNGTTAVAYNTSSDYRLKNITGPITTSGAYIDNLNPVEGTWKADGSTFVGLIAHEVQEASRTPVATGTKDGEQMQGMDYSSAEIIANLIAEIQSLRTRVAALESN